MQKKKKTWFLCLLDLLAICQLFKMIYTDFEITMYLQMGDHIIGLLQEDS